MSLACVKSWVQLLVLPFLHPTPLLFLLTIMDVLLKYMISETGTTIRFLCCRSKKPDVHAILLKENWPNQ